MGTETMAGDDSDEMEYQYRGGLQLIMLGIKDMLELRLKMWKDLTRLTVNLSWT